MAKISSYVSDTVISGGDRVLGTDAVGSITKNYALNALKIFFDIVSIRTITSTSYTALEDDNLILVDDDTAGGEVTIDLPAASENEGLKHIIKKIGATANVVVDASTTETIDGSLTATLKTQYESITVICDGSNWFII